MIATGQKVYTKYSYADAINRWAGIGPYYAMFPLEFAFDVVYQHSSQNQTVLDPFAGRASSVYAAAMQNRIGVGIEINPVGWVYGRAKLHTGMLAWVEKRLGYLKSLANRYINEAANMPEFFQYCYCPEVLSFLLAARATLNWRRSNPDATLMALLLVYLHGKREQSLSNQMRQAKAMSPEYSVNWWKENSPQPPQIDPYEFMLQRVKWRYEKGRPQNNNSEVYLGDSTRVLKKIKNKVIEGSIKPFSLLFTSPPYCGITNYYYDQWLRLWLMGGSDHPCSPGEKYKRKFESKAGYRELLLSVFSISAELMANRATVYVRTDAREFTRDTTLEVLHNCFPSWNEQIIDRPFPEETQTALYGDKSRKPGEIDIVLTKNV
jgi:hypothetical protein